MFFSQKRRVLWNHEVYRYFNDIPSPYLPLFIYQYIIYQYIITVVNLMIVYFIDQYIRVSYLWKSAILTSLYVFYLWTDISWQSKATWHLKPPTTCCMHNTYIQFGTTDNYIMAKLG